MKKLIIASACIALALSAFAQPDVVKNAERAMKSKAPAAKVLETITPAFTNAETAELAQTWYIPGKAFYNDYDEAFALKQFNKLDEAGEHNMNEALLSAYEYFKKALPLDSVPDAKGKIKTKYSKQIIADNAGHLADFYNAGGYFWGQHQYGKAYDAWQAYVEIVKDPRSQRPMADTILAEVIYNQAIAAWQGEELEKALNSFLKAKDMGYNKKQLYDYAIAVAYQAKNEDAVFALSQEALPLYGAEDTNYMNMIINHYIVAQDYEQAGKVIDDAIAASPENAQYYVIKGILLETKEDRNGAKEQYEKAIAIDPYHAAALANYGRLLYDMASILSDEAPLDQQEYSKYFVEKLKPAMLKAVEVLENAYNVDNDNTDALRYLENLYYNLNDEKNLEYTRQRLNN